MGRGCLRAPLFRYALAPADAGALPSGVSDIIHRSAPSSVEPVATLAALTRGASSLGTLADDAAILPPADAPAVDPVVGSVSSRQGALLSLATEMLRFGTVGGLGLLWDVSTFYLVERALNLLARPVPSFVGATLAAYLVAATMNWTLNRLWTFRGRSSRDGLFRQWLSFLGANGLGFSLNRSMVFLLAWYSPFCFAHPVVALAAGSLSGMSANFILSRRLVFRPPGSQVQ